MDRRRCRIAGQPEEWLAIVLAVKSVSCRGVHAQTHRRGRRLTPLYTQKQSRPQRASVGSAGATSGQRRIVAVLGAPGLFDSVAIHLLAVTQKQRAARTASVTNNTCLHTSSLLGSRVQGMQRYGNTIDVDKYTVMQGILKWVKHKVAFSVVG